MLGMPLTRACSIWGVLPVTRNWYQSRSDSVALTRRPRRPDTALPGSSGVACSGPLLGSVSTVG